MIETIEFEMKQLNRKRNIMIYVPDDYKSSNKRYPVMYIHDGQNVFFDDQAYQGVSWGFLEYVKEHSLDIIMVAIPCNFEGHKREDEYGPWIVSEEITLIELGEVTKIGGEGDQYIQFIIHELKPYIDEHYSSDPNDTATVGSSSGGVISAYAAFKYPEVFSKCAALSSAFWFYEEEFQHLIETMDVTKLGKLYFDLGGNEGNGNLVITKLYFESNYKIRELLKKRNVDFIMNYYPNAFHSEAQWRKRVPIFMKYFYNLENK